MSNPNILDFLKRFTFLFVSILLSAIALPLQSQSLHFFRYAEDEGLQNTLVKSVTSDKNGFVWVGTDDGLFRFDGHNFAKIHDELPSHYVKSVFCRKNGDIIASTDLGIIQIKNTPLAWDISVIKKGSVKDVDSLLWFPKTVYEDAKGILWFSDNRKIYRMKDNLITPYFPGTAASTNNFLRSFSFAEDGFGNLYSFSEPGSIYRYDKNKDSFVAITLPFNLTNIQGVVAVDAETMLIACRDDIFELKVSPAGEAKSLIPLNIKIEASYIICSSPGHFLAGTWSNGLMLISKRAAGYTISPFPDFPEKTVNQLYLAKGGNVWIATDNGMYLMKPSLFGSPYNNYTTKYIQSIAEYPDGKICFTDGESVFATDPSSGVTTTLKKDLKTLILVALPRPEGIWYADVNGQVWLEDAKGRLVRKFNFSSSGRAVFNLLADNAGNVWACQDLNESLICIRPNFTVKKYGSKEGITSRPLTVAMDKKGMVYAGGMADKAFLFAYSPASDNFTNLSQPLVFEKNIDININDVACSNKGVIWLGTSFGLIKYENGKYTRLETGEMTSSSVKAVAIDKNENVWFGNSTGLHQYANGEVLSFDERAGMSSKSIDYRCLLIDNQNRIWAGTVSGLVVSSPIRPPTKTVSPVIVSMILNDKPIHPQQAEEITFNERSFVTLKVGVPDFPAKDLVIEIFLQGRDTAWSPLNKSNEIHFANLNPGEYTLLIRARQFGNYLNSTPLKWAFTVTRNWYFLWWVILLEGVLLLFLYWVGLKWYTSKLKLNNEKLEQAVHERTREIITQKEQIQEQSDSIFRKNEVLAETNIELQQEKIKAEKASKAKSEFLTVMSHELRTPLHAVIGTAHLLIQNSPRPDQFENLRTLRFSAENLLALINNILDFNKIESEKISLEHINFNLKMLIEEILSTMTVRAKLKNIELSSHYDDRLPVNVLGDPLRLSQIMNNLVSNALKFTEEGSVTIDVRLNSRTGNTWLFDFAVKDTGIGMKEDTLKTVFEAFTQASSETSRKYGGTGIGLTITRKLLELHGSEIKVESEFGKGSRFYFSIQFDEGHAPSADALLKNDSYEFQDFKGQHILLVEDNKVNILIAKKFLSGWNLVVETAENGLIAVEKIQQQHFDLVLMDLQMPEMDGYQATAAIRQLGVEPYVSVPVIALTASSKADVFENIFLSGMNDFISKPFNPVELHEKIRTFLE